MTKAKCRFDYDVAIIGGGSAGYAAARTAALNGLNTVVIEGGEEVGGLCILRGCMPTKALLYAAEVMHLANHTSTWGVRVNGTGFEFAKVMARKNALIREFADDRRAQLDSGKFKFVRANAKFIDSHTIELTLHSTKQPTPDPAQEGNGGRAGAVLPTPLVGVGSQLLRAKNFIITTGSIVAPPPLPQLAEVGYLTSDDALKIQRLPKSLIVLGGGPVAVEFAQFFARFGVKVTLIQRSEHILREFDPDAAEVIETVFRRESMKLYTNTKLTGVQRRGKLKSISFLHRGRTVSVSGEQIMFALGRAPNTAALGLDNANVATERGRIVTDEFMQTSAPHIYAAGDCTSPHEIVHLAVQQAEIAAHNIAHRRSQRRMDSRLLTTIVFTEPQVAAVGLTEKEARARNILHLTASYPFKEHGKSLIMEAKDGFVKLLANPKSGEILGGACVGPLGGELIHEIVAAMAKRMTVHELAAMPHYHPTLAEIWTYPAEELAEKIATR